MLCDGFIGHAHVKIGIHQREQVYLNIVAWRLRHIFIYEDIFHTGIPEVKIFDKLSSEVHIFDLFKVLAPRRGYSQRKPDAVLPQLQLYWQKGQRSKLACEGVPFTER
jgi:hypothetical protein